MEPSKSKLFAWARIRQEAYAMPRGRSRRQLRHAVQSVRKQGRDHAGCECPADRPHGRALPSCSRAGDACQRILAAVDIAIAVMLEDPQVSRAVIGSLGAPSEEPGQVSLRSRALWADTIGEADGFASDVADLGRTALPDHLAMAFRGVLSFWTAGQIEDAALAARARASASALLLGFVQNEQRARLTREIGQGP